MPLLTRTPSAVAVLRMAAAIYRQSLAVYPQPPDPFVAIGRAAEHLDAPASVELQATHALEEALGADSEELAFTAAIDAQMRRRLDIDLWLADWRAGQ